VGRAESVQALPEAAFELIGSHGFGGYAGGPSSA
jgi:hypothetical protein